METVQIDRTRSEGPVPGGENTQGGEENAGNLFSELLQGLLSPSLNTGVLPLISAETNDIEQVEAPVQEEASVQEAVVEEQSNNAQLTPEREDEPELAKDASSNVEEEQVADSDTDLREEQETNQQGERQSVSQAESVASPESSSTEVVKESNAPAAQTEVAKDTEAAAVDGEKVSVEPLDLSKSTQQESSSSRDRGTAKNAAQTTNPQQVELEAGDKAAQTVQVEAPVAKNGAVQAQEPVVTIRPIEENITKPILLDKSSALANANAGAQPQLLSENLAKAVGQTLNPQVLLNAVQLNSQVFQNPLNTLQSLEGSLAKIEQAAFGNKGDSLGSSATSKGKDAKSLPRSQQEKTIQRMKELLKNVEKTRAGTSMTVRLDPPRLGTVTLKVQRRGDQTIARLIPENQDVESLLRGRVGELTQVLVAGGLKAEDVHISIGREQSESSFLEFEQFAQGQGSQDGSEKNGAKEKGSKRTGSMQSGATGNSLGDRTSGVEIGWVA